MKIEKQNSIQLEQGNYLLRITDPMNGDVSTILCVFKCKPSYSDLKQIMIREDINFGYTDWLEDTLTDDDEDSLFDNDIITDLLAGRYIELGDLTYDLVEFIEKVLVVDTRK